jgi:hypothetical protein
MLNAMFEAMDDDDRDETSLELIQEPGLMDALNFYIKVQKQGNIYQTSASLILFSLSDHGSEHAGLILASPLWPEVLHFTGRRSSDEPTVIYHAIFNLVVSTAALPPTFFSAPSVQRSFVQGLKCTHASGSLRRKKSGGLAWYPSISASMQTLNALSDAVPAAGLDPDDVSDIITAVFAIMQKGENVKLCCKVIDRIIGDGSAEQRGERALNLLIDHPEISALVGTVKANAGTKYHNVKLLFSRELLQNAQKQQLEDQVALRESADARVKRMEQEKTQVERENAELKRKLEEFTNAKNGGGEKRVKREKGAPKLAECRVCFESLVSGTKPSIIACSKCTDVRYHTRCAGEFKDRCVQCKEQTVARMTMVEVEELKRRQRAAGDDE